MIRAISVFAFIFFFLVFAQLLWKVMTKQDKWEFTKILFRGIIISMATIAIMFAIVVFF